MSGGRWMWDLNVSVKVVKPLPHTNSETDRIRVEAFALASLREAQALVGITRVRRSLVPVLLTTASIVRKLSDASLGADPSVDRRLVSVEDVHETSLVVSEASRKILTCFRDGVDALDDAYLEIAVTDAESANKILSVISRAMNGFNDESPALWELVLRELERIDVGAAEVARSGLRDP